MANNSIKLTITMPRDAYSEELLLQCIQSITPNVVDISYKQAILWLDNTSHNEAKVIVNDLIDSALIEFEFTMERGE